jgi:hypothetical protein
LFIDDFECFSNAKKALGEKYRQVPADRGDAGVPFDSAQGRLSTPFGWRLSSLRITFGKGL